MWLARTTDGVTHATAEPDRYEGVRRNTEGITSTACGLVIARDSAPRSTVLARAVRDTYVSLFRGTPAEVTCKRCRVSTDLLCLDDGRDERGAEVAA